MGPISSYYERLSHGLTLRKTGWGVLKKNQFLRNFTKVLFRLARAELLSCGVFLLNRVCVFFFFLFFSAYSSLIQRKDVSFISGKWRFICINYRWRESEGRKNIFCRHVIYFPVYVPECYRERKMMNAQKSFLRCFENFVTQIFTSLSTVSHLLRYAFLFGLFFLEVLTMQSVIYLEYVLRR